MKILKILLLLLVIKPNGEVRIMLYAKYSLKNILIVLGLAQPGVQSGYPIAFTHYKSNIIRVFEGFQIISITKDHIFPYEIESYKNHIYKKKIIYRFMLSFLSRILEKILGWHLLIKAKPIS